MKPDKNEQWLLNGKCSICRRKNYCKTQCKKSKQHHDAVIRGAAFSMMMKLFTSKR